MFEQELATCEAKESGNQWFGKELTRVDEWYVRANWSFDGNSGGGPGIGGRSPIGSPRSPVAINLAIHCKIV